MIGRILKSLKSRIDGIMWDLNSHYWEYSKYFEDGVLWENSFLFESFGGTNFQGNPYYVFRAAFQDKRLMASTFFIVHNDCDRAYEFLKYKKLLDGRVHIIKKNSNEYRNALAHCKYLVNNVSFPMDYIKKPGQVYVNTWHGTPLKSLGRNIKNDPFEMTNSQRNFLLCDYLIAPNLFTRKILIEDYCIPGEMKNKVINMGYPRNCVFYDGDQRKYIRTHYHLESKTAILYMPTWRGTAMNVQNINQVEEMEQLAKVLGDDYRIYVKLHPATISCYGSIDYKYCIPVPENEEIYEFLNGMDILITDYSSVLFDFSVTGKKIILYQYDKESYFRNRGIYEEIDKEIIFPVVTDLKALAEEILNSDHVVNIDEFKNNFNIYDNAYAAQKIVDLMISDKPLKNEAEINLHVIDYPVTDRELLDKKELLNTGDMLAFVCNKKNKHFNNIRCFSQLEYIRVYSESRLTPVEKIKWILCKKSRLYLIKRERYRLFGDLKIARVFSQKHAHDFRLPICLKKLS